MKFGLLRMLLDEETLTLHCCDFETKEEAIRHAQFHKIQHQYPGNRWFVVPMEEVEVPL